MSTLDIIIVNFNSGSQLSDCLKSIEKIDDKLLINQIIVVDNASTDGSIENIENFKLPLKIVKNQVNEGFAKACNKGAALGNSKYILFLNPDTKLYSDSISISIKFMENVENSNVGILGIKLVDDEGEVTGSCSKFPTFFMFLDKILGLHHLLPKGLVPIQYYDFDFNESRIVDQVSGAFFLVRRSVFEKLKGFDERFFVYFEDLDFALRAKNIGYSSYYLALTKAYHKGGGTSKQINGIALFYFLRSQILYFYKHFNKFLASVLTFTTLFIEPITRLLFSIVNKSSAYKSKDVLQAYCLLWRSLIRGSLTED